MMDLILWRHAEAHEGEDGLDDLERALTPRGEKQAARMAAWLDRQLPDGLRVLASPARRTEQTARVLGRKVKLRAELLPGGSPEELLELVQWPRARGAVLVVGHQPLLGQTAARLRASQSELDMSATLLFFPDVESRGSLRPGHALCMPPARLDFSVWPVPYPKGSFHAG